MVERRWRQSKVAQIRSGRGAVISLSSPVLLQTSRTTLGRHLGSREKLTYIDSSFLRKVWRPRAPHVHVNNFGHITGSGYMIFNLNLTVFVAYIQSGFHTYNVAFAPKLATKQNI